MATRQQVRERLATVFTAEGSFNQVYGYAPLDLQGFDKVLAIFSDRTRHQLESSTLETNFYTFTLDVYVKRASGENTEDSLDTLHEAIRSVVRANQSDANWDWLSLEETSDAYFAEVSGIPYRVETHPLTVKVKGS